MRLIFLRQEANSLALESEHGGQTSIIEGHDGRYLVRKLPNSSSFQGNVVHGDRKEDSFYADGYLVNLEACILFV